MAQPHLEVILRYRKRTSVSSLKNPIALAVGVSMKRNIALGVRPPSLMQSAERYTKSAMSRSILPTITVLRR